MAKQAEQNSREEDEHSRGGVMPMSASRPDRLIAIQRGNPPSADQVGRAGAIAAGRGVTIEVARPASVQCRAMGSLTAGSYTLPQGPSARPFGPRSASARPPPASPAGPRAAFSGRICRSEPVDPNGADHERGPIARLAPSRTPNIRRAGAYSPEQGRTVPDQATLGGRIRRYRGDSVSTGYGKKVRESADAITKAR